MSTVSTDLRDLGLQDIPEHTYFDSELLSVMGETLAQGVIEPRFRNLLPDAAEWLAGLVIEDDIKVAVELGTSNGYSALALAGALTHTNGYLTTYEKYPDRAALARNALDQARLLGRVSVKTADGVRELTNYRGPIDLLFMDIWPGDYVTAVRNARHALRPGSIIVADNMLEHRDRLGRLHPAAGSGSQEYLDFVDEEPGCRSVLLAKGCGLLITRLDR